MKTNLPSSGILTKPFLLAAALACGPLLPVEQAAAQAAPVSVANLRNTAPYDSVGRLTMRMGTSNRVGSATVIKPYSLLTAGHNLYSKGTGWRTNVVFQRSYHNGTSASSSSASRLFIPGGYAAAVDSGSATTNTAFSRDTGGVICFSRPMNGGHAGWWANTALLTGSAYNMSLGYGAQVSNGGQLQRSAPTRAFTLVTGSYYKNATYGLEGGMSGGPVFARSGTSWYVCAVNVSGPVAVNTGAGVRALDTDTVNLIRNNLQ